MSERKKIRVHMRGNANGKDKRDAREGEDSNKEKMRKWNECKRKDRELKRAMELVRRR